MRRVSVFGATGSIGQNTIDLIARAPEAYRVVALTGGQNIARLAADARRLNAEIAVTADEARLDDLRDALAGSGVGAAAGPIDAVGPRWDVPRLGDDLSRLIGLPAEKVAGPEIRRTRRRQRRSRRQRYDRPSRPAISCARSITGAAHTASLGPDPAEHRRRKRMADHSAVSTPVSKVFKRL